MADSLVAPVVAASVTVCGWFVTYFYTKRMEDRRRRLEVRLHHLSQQIEQLYGPLLSLIEQVFNVWRVRENILENGDHSDEQMEAIRVFIWKKYFAPLHAEIAGLLRTKLYLLEGSALPTSFSEYLEHARQEDCQHLLWDELHIDTPRVPKRPWPESFYPEVKATLQKLMDDRQRDLALLR